MGSLGVTQKMIAMITPMTIQTTQWLIVLGSPVVRPSPHLFSSVCWLNYCQTSAFIASTCSATLLVGHTAHDVQLIQATNGGHRLESTQIRP